MSDTLIENRTTRSHLCENWVVKTGLEKKTENWVRSDPLPGSGSQRASNVDSGLGWRWRIPTATSCKP